MSNYTKTVNFATKDNLSPGNPLKIVKGTEIDTEYNNIATAVATKTDNSAAAITGGTIENTTIGATTAATGSFTTLAASGTTTLAGALVGAVTQAAFNTVSTTLNLGGAATAVNIGAATGTATVANTTLAAKAITASTTLAVTGTSTLTGAVTATAGVTGPITSSNATITGGTITGITDLAVADGGTGASTAANALNNLLPSQTGNANKYLQTDGTNSSWDAVSLSTADISGTLAVANGGTGVTTSTGTTNVVLSNSPTLVTPALGTPSAAVLTNATGLPISTGVSGLGTDVATFLATPSSANLISAVTDETGTGALVFSTSPTLVTPALGTPASGVATNLTGLPISTGVSGLGTGVATLLVTPSSANLASAITDETGSGSLVFATSPTLVTPILGTPTSGTLTNATGLPISTGVSGLGTGVATFLATPSSANLAAALTDETGTGANVFATSPTLVTPILGTPTSATLTNATGLPLTTGVTGNLPVTNLNNGTSASSATFWRGDGIWSAPAGAGTVTSVAATVPSVFSISGSPITSSGTLAMTYSGTALPVANGGTNSTATPTAGTVPYGTGTALAYTSAGTSGQLLQSNGASAPTWVAPSSGALSFITSVTASNSATVDIENAMNVYDVYVIEGVNIVTSLNNVDLYIRLKIGGTYITTSTYLYAAANNFATYTAVAVANASTAVDFIQVLQGLSSTAARTANVSIKIFNPSSTTIGKQVSFNYAFRDSSAVTNTLANGFGSGVNSGTGAVTGVRLYANYGNITSGTFRLYGIANS